MRSYKRTPTPVLLKDNGKNDSSLFAYACICLYFETTFVFLFFLPVSNSPMTTKRLSSDDDDDDDEDDEEHDEEPRKRLKIVTKKQKSNETPPLPPTQFGIFIQCNGPVSCNIFSTNETVSSTATTNNADVTTTVAKTESEIIIKKQNENENTQIYFEKFQQQYQTIPRFNLNNEQSLHKSTTLNRTDSQR
jgi:hypothetical protein